MVIMRGAGGEPDFHFKKDGKIFFVGSSTQYCSYYYLISCLTPPGVAAQKNCAQAQNLVMVAVLPCRRHARQADFD